MKMVELKKIFKKQVETLYFVKVLFFKALLKFNLNLSKFKNTQISPMFELSVSTMQDYHNSMLECYFFHI